MILELDRPHAEALAQAFPRLTTLRDQLRFGEKAQIPLAQMEHAELDFLGELYTRAGSRGRSRATQLATLREALSGDDVRLTADDLEDLVPAIARYLLKGAIRGWLFSASAAGRPLPYVVTRIDYTPPTNDETGRVFIELKANAKGSTVTLTLRIGASDIAGKTVAQVFAERGLIRETQALIDACDATTARYFDWRARYGAQFSGNGTGFYAEDPNSSRRDVDWSRKDLIVLASHGGDARLVNDESVLTQRSLVLDATGDVLGAYLRKASKSNQYENEDAVQACEAAIPKGLFTRLPVHPYILMFHLELHHYLWVHVDDVRPYEYRPELKQKLILPEEQTDLVDILTAEMDVLRDDIIAGKSGGTTVLCAGPPGVGKTLTAEVYSEAIRRPLYRVHSGQLGLNVAAMESALKDALMRAQRWGAVMLIDEADVYIKRRADDMTMNAVVGVFLRVLEYFNGLLFLTTNRVEDIDEAIVSRCIAMIRYNAPDAEARARIWHVMLAQFGVTVDDEIVPHLVERFPTATGRDIKGLAKLVSKYCGHKGVAPTLAVFQRCSMFRGMDA
jgi:hypothetical protein